MSLSGVVQMGQFSLVMSLMGLFMVAYIRGRQRPQGVYKVREEWRVMFLVCYVRDGLYPLFVQDGLCCLVRDLYLVRSDIIRIVTLKNNKSNIL